MVLVMRYQKKGRYAEGTKLNTHTTKVNLERDWLFLFGKSD